MGSEVLITGEAMAVDGEPPASMMGRAGRAGVETHSLYL